MRPFWSGMLLIGMITGAAWATAEPLHARSAARPTARFVRGVALGLFSGDPDWNYGALIDEIRARGATDVLVVVNAVQSDRFASDIEMRPGHSPSEATLARTLRQIREAGMRAALMPIVRLAERQPHEWRGVIAPADGLDAWFASYGRFVLPLARVAQAERVGRFVVGSELSSLEAYEPRWRTLIHEVRTVFEGTITYSANWDHANAVPFWDALDEVGLTAYFPLGGDALESSRAVADAWMAPRAVMENLSERLGKPVLVTEVGYPSRQSAATRPWDDSGTALVDLDAQRQLYRGFCNAFAETPSVSGFYVWNWFGFGGPRDGGFTPRGKPAAAELENCFALKWPSRSRGGDRS